MPYLYDMMLGDIRSLVRDVPGGIRESEIGKSADGRSLKLLLFGSENAAHHVLIQAAIHAREYTTAQLVMALIKDLAGKYPSGLGDVCFHVVPMLNPDGAEIANGGAEVLRDGALRASVEAMLSETDFMDWKANARGVDLNRNFPSGWSEIPLREAGGAGCRGSRPLCEPETEAISKYIFSRRFDAIINYHSYGSVIYQSGAANERLAKDTLELAELFSGICGYPVSEDEVQTTERAGLKDWALEELDIPSITIEIGAIQSRVDQAEFKDILPKHIGTWEALADWVRRK